jgi:hypothetical protein
MRLPSRWRLCEQRLSLRLVRLRQQRTSLRLVLLRVRRLSKVDMEWNGMASE